MGHTNETTNLHLPQFIGSDKPTWLGDINGAFQSIDSAYATIEASASGAVSTAQNAATMAQNASDAAASAQTAASGAATDAATAIATANNAAETANNAQSTAVLAKGVADAAAANIGDLAELGTTDKSSVVAAINEVVAELPTVGDSVSVTADGNKTYSQLLGDLYALINFTKLTHSSALVIVTTASNANTCYQIGAHTPTTATFGRFTIEPSAANGTYVVLTNGAYIVRDWNGSAVTERNNTVVTAGDVFTLYY